MNILVIDINGFRETVSHSCLREKARNTEIQAEGKKYATNETLTLSKTRARAERRLKRENL